MKRSGHRDPKSGRKAFKIGRQRNHLSKRRDKKKLSDTYQKDTEFVWIVKEKNT